MTLSSDISTTSTALSDIKSAIIAKGVTPTGNITTYAAAIGNIPAEKIKYGASIDDMLGNPDANGVLQAPSETFTFTLPSGVTDVGSNVLVFKFAYNAGLTSANLSSLTTVSGINGLYNSFTNCTGLTSVDLSSLTTVSGINGLYYAFTNCTGLTSVSFPALTTVSGNNGLSYAFNGCIYLTSVSFPALTTVSGSSALTRCFGQCIYLTSVSFPALTTSSFGSSYTNQFNNMLTATGTTTTHTLHFPSNMQSTISGLSGYPNFGGTSGYVTLSFDLPATS